jgi:hypothetical protein
MEQKAEPSTQRKDMTIFFLQKSVEEGSIIRYLHIKFRYCEELDYRESF